jgi:hypothetical protein
MTMLVPLTVAARKQVAITPSYLVTMITNVPKITVIRLTDVAMIKSLVMITICVPEIAVAQKLDATTMK